VSEVVIAPVAEVSVLEDRASVVRRGRIALRAGQQRLVIERVSPVLVDKTLLATCTNARVLDIRCERYIAPWREASSAEPPSLLRAERSRLAKEQGVPPYVIFHDTTLRAMAMARPRDLGEMTELPGVGTAKLSRYGQAFLSVIRATV